MDMLVRTLKEVIPLAFDFLVLEHKRRVLVIVENEKNLEKTRQKVKNINTSYSIRIILLKNLFYDKELLLWLTKGKSLKHDKALIDIMHSSKKAIITYSLENLDHVKKTMFGYALKGRNRDAGFLKTINGETLGRNNIILPAKKLDQAIQFMKYWKVSYAVKTIIEVDG